jgi:hypothetical protein
MSHVENFKHFIERGIILLLNQSEYRWNFKQIIFYNFKIINKMENFGLSTSRTMYYAMKFASVRK